MTRNFAQLAAPNYSAKTSFADLTAYCLGGLLLILPVIPLPELKFYFAIFTLTAYSGVFLSLAFIDITKSAREALNFAWQMELTRARIELNTT